MINHNTTRYEDSISARKSVEVASNLRLLLLAQAGDGGTLNPKPSPRSTG